MLLWPAGGALAIIERSPVPIGLSLRLIIAGLTYSAADNMFDLLGFCMTLNMLQHELAYSFCFGIHWSIDPLIFSHCVMFVA